MAGLRGGGSLMRGLAGPLGQGLYTGFTPLLWAVGALAFAAAAVVVAAGALGRAYPQGGLGAGELEGCWGRSGRRARQPCPTFCS